MARLVELGMKEIFMKKDHSKSFYDSTSVHIGSISVASSSREIQESKRVRCGAPQAFFTF